KPNERDALFSLNSPSSILPLSPVSSRTQLARAFQIRPRPTTISFNWGGVFEARWDPTLGNRLLRLGGKGKKRPRPNLSLAEVAVAFHHLFWSSAGAAIRTLPAMFRNQYDNDVTVWSPQGRIHQIEYAMEAVKQGSATVGLKSKTHAVLVALKRAQSELAAHQKKILYVDNHIGISIAGLTADARLLCNFMRQECLDSRFVFDRPLPVSRLVSLIGSKTQIPTQRYGRRPYGVGLLIAGYDDMGPHIFQTCPSANYFDCKAMSIGARSQSARTYLERHMTEFAECNLNELVKHGLRALRETLPAEQDLTIKARLRFFFLQFNQSETWLINVSVGIVGKEMEFTIYDDDDVAPFLEGLEERPQRKPAQPAEDTAEKPEEPMEH
ncbi:putative Proteasome endopeptidase complex protein, partial [Naja naja]